MSHNWQRTSKCWINVSDIQNPDLKNWSHFIIALCHILPRNDPRHGQAGVKQGHRATRSQVTEEQRRSLACQPVRVKRNAGRQDDRKEEEEGQEEVEEEDLVSFTEKANLCSREVRREFLTANTSHGGNKRRIFMSIKVVCEQMFHCGRNYT